MAPNFIWWYWDLLSSQWGYLLETSSMSLFRRRRVFDYFHWLVCVWLSHRTSYWTYVCIEPYMLRKLTHPPPRYIFNICFITVSHMYRYSSTVVSLKFLKVSQFFAKVSLKHEHILGYMVKLLMKLLVHGLRTVWCW